MKPVETNCFHDGKEYSSGSSIVINGVKKQCTVGFWMDDIAKKSKLNQLSTPSLVELAGLAQRPANDPIGTCHYAGKKYSSGATLTIEGVKNTCIFGSWSNKNKGNASNQQLMTADGIMSMLK